MDLSQFFLCLFDAAQLVEDEIDYEIKDFGSVISSSPESSKMMSAPSVKSKDIFVKPSSQSFSSDYNGFITKWFPCEIWLFGLIPSFYNPVGVGAVDGV